MKNQLTRLVFQFWPFDHLANDYYGQFSSIQLCYESKGKQKKLKAKRLMPDHILLQFFFARQFCKFIIFQTLISVQKSKTFGRANYNVCKGGIKQSQFPVA